ncbi:MAG: hypothetical protein ACK56F_05265, partial [bacterium]
MDHGANGSDGRHRHGLRDVPAGGRPAWAHQADYRLRSGLRGEVLRPTRWGDGRVRDPAGEGPRGATGTTARGPALQDRRAPLGALGRDDLEARRLCRERRARMDKRHQELPARGVGDHPGGQPQTRPRGARG